MKDGRKVLFIVSLVVLIAAISGIVIYFLIRSKDQRNYEDLKEIAYSTSEAAETIEAPETETANAIETVTETTTEETTQAVQIPIDFKALQDINSDMYAWLQIPGTEIDYPILHSSEDDPDHYLSSGPSGYGSLLGSIYTQSNHNKDFETDPVTVIYGHRTLYGGMFGILGDYFDSEFRDAHSEIYVYTPQHIYKYKVVFAVTFGDDLLLYRFNDCEEESDYQDLLDAIQTERLIPSWISNPFEVTTKDRIIILSTCNNYSEQRVLIGAVLTEEK